MIFTLRLLCITVALTVLITASCWGYPTFFGETGLVLTPTADVLPVSYLQVAADYTRIDDCYGTTTKSFPLRLVYGASENTELFVFAGRIGRDSITSFEVLGAGVKLGVIKEDIYKKIPGIAVGARVYRIRQSEDTDVVDGYAVMSKAILAKGDLATDGYVVRVHGGISFTKYSGYDDSGFFSPFGGLSLVNTSGNSIAIDYIPKQSNDSVTFRESTLSGSIRRRLSDTIWLQLGATRLFGISAKKDFFLGLMYRYGDTQVIEPEKQIFYY
ncbi:MAG: hypothetical protein ACYDBB_09210 [Armatimonadota bacterium]